MRAMVRKKIDFDKVMETVRLRIKSLDYSRSGRSLCYVDQSVMERLGLSTGDIIEITGRKKTAGIIVTSSTDKGKEIIRIDGTQRLNLGSDIGEIVSIRYINAVPAKEIELAPITDIYDIKKQADAIKGKLIDKPLMVGDIIDIPGAIIKSNVGVNPMNGFTRMLNMRGNPKRPILGPLRLVVLNTSPIDKVVRITRDTRIKINKKIVYLNSSGKLFTSDDIGGLEKELSEIKKILEFSLNIPTFTEKFNIEPPRGILLVGPTGMGKTLLAKVIANETDYNFISILPSDIFLKYQGASEKKLKKLFSEAEVNAPSIIFIDHIETIAPIIQKEAIESSSSLEHRIETQLMALMDGMQPYRNVIVLGVTHKLELMEPALLRPGRFDKIIRISLPDLSGRVKIYQIHTKYLPLDEEISLEEIAKLSEKFTGADIKGVCRLAIMNAAEREKQEINTEFDKISDDSNIQLKISREDFLNAIKEITDRLN